MAQAPAPEPPLAQPAQATHRALAEELADVEHTLARLSALRIHTTEMPMPWYEREAERLRTALRTLLATMQRTAAEDLGDLWTVDNATHQVRYRTVARCRKEHHPTGATAYHDAAETFHFYYAGITAFATEREATAKALQQAQEDMDVLADTMRQLDRRLGQLEYDQQTSAQEDQP